MSSWLLCAVALGCGARSSSNVVGDAGDPRPAEALRAQEFIGGQSALPERAEALALAESVEARATREGAGTRAAELHAMAAALIERVWQAEGHDQDAQESIDIYRAASRDPNTPGACEAALAGARLAGNLAHDALTAYAELYRVQRRFASSQEGDAGTPSSCQRELEAALDVLAGFRPPQRVLEAIDEGLIGEGAVAPALDAGVVPAAARAPRITRIEAWPGPEATRVVVALDRPANYRVGDDIVTGAASPRTFVELDGVDVADAPRDTPMTGVVQRVRADPTATGARVLLDLDGRAWRRAFTMREPYRIVLDVARRPPGLQGRAARQVERVVIDPGHGGKDTGAVGANGLKEKDVTLDIAHRAAPILAAQGVQVVLTRDEDRFVSLEERTARANAFAADLFVSVHCNATEARAHRGIETYVLDVTRDEIAARVAARENATTQAATSELAGILGGMRLADDGQRSTRFAHLLQRAATTAVQMKYGDAADGGVHTAGFYVLVGARMPSVLFETSYISNPIDEDRLSSAQVRQLFADAIANAVRAYREGR